MPTLALCMIVKNEEEMLAGCLESVKGIVDEMVVVDTGSTDNTKQIALDAGAKVFDFAWINDFAAARNFAKSKTDCDFILSLDADERLYVEDKEFFNEQFVDQKCYVGMVGLINVTEEHSDWRERIDVTTEQSQVMVPRILKNLQDVYWVGRIHEVPTHTTNSFSSRSLIVHLGGSLTYRKKRNKNQRNLQLLELTLANNEETNPLFYSYLALERLNSGNLKGYEEALKMGWEKFDGWIDQEVESNSNAEISIGVVALYPSILARYGNFAEALSVISRLLNILPILSNPVNTLFVVVNSFIEHDGLTAFPVSFFNILYDSIEYMIENFEGKYFEPTLPIINKQTLFEQQLHLSLIFKDFESFNRSYLQAKIELPDNLSIALWNVESLIEQGDLLGSFEEWFTLLDRFGIESPDTWVLGTIILLGLGQEEEAQVYLKNALDRSHVPFTSEHRNNIFKSLLVRLAVLKGEPYPGNGTYGVIGAILSRQPVLRERTVPSSIIHQVVDQYVAIGKVELLLRFFDSRAEVILPGVGEMVKSRLTELGFELVDDNEQTPIVLFGTCLDDVLQIFRMSTELSVIELNDADKADLDERITNFQDQAMEDLFSAGMNFLDMDEESTSPLNDFFQLKLDGLEQRPLIVWDSSWPIEMLSDFLPSKQMMVYLGDPAKTHTSEQDLFAWNQMNIEAFQAVGGDLFFSNLKHMSTHTQNAIDEMFAYFGLTTPRDVVNHISLDATCLQTLETDFTQGVEQDILKQWKFLS